MTHPFENELFLLKKAIDKIPFTFSDEDKLGFEAKFKEFEADENVTRDKIEEQIVEIGKAVWPYRKAYEDMVSTYAQEKLEEFFKKHLSAPTLEKFEQFIKAGGNIKDFRRGKEFEEAFTPEENMEIEKALFDVQEDIKEFMKNIVQENQAEYEESLSIYTQKQEDLLNMMQSLKGMASKSEKWASEILNKVRDLEQGWSVVERDFDEDKIKHEIEYWQGVLGMEEAE